MAFQSGAFQSGGFQQSGQTAPAAPTTRISDIRDAYGLSYAGGRVMATKKYKPRKLSKEDIKKLMSIGFQVGKASQAAKQKAQAEALMPHINAQLRKRAA